MKQIKLLDCTLRDGGYVNNWRFGSTIMTKIVEKLIMAGVDILEGGYLSSENAGDPDVARYLSIDDVSRVLNVRKDENQDYAVMINLGEYPLELLPQANDNSPILRIAFHKNDMEKAFSYFKGVEKRKYRYYVQPMGALNYTDEEYVRLICQINTLKTEAFYIVDSFGVMEMKDFRRLLYMADNNLRKDIFLGYHAHNNLQQAYSNAKYMVEQSIEHDIILDASVFGMGRGAGNLNIELFAKYLNENFYKHYNIESFLEVFDECLKPIFINQFWGYSLPYYLSSIHNCHPNYASFLVEKNTLSVKSMHELLHMISEEDKTTFTKEKAQKYYLLYQENWIDDRENISQLKKIIEGRNILILAPGKTIVDYRNDVERYVLENNPVIIGINRASDLYKYDFLFVTNERRLTNIKPTNVNRYIKTSNLHKRLTETIKINYASYLCSEIGVSDDPTLMLMNLLISIGINEIAIAGFDGFSSNPEDNYFTSELSMGSPLQAKLKKNKLISTELEHIKEKLIITFITPSKYIENK